MPVNVMVRVFCGSMVVVVSGSGESGAATGQCDRKTGKSERTTTYKLHQIISPRWSD
jgi:hypothetical protein